MLYLGSYNCCFPDEDIPKLDWLNLNLKFTDSAAEDRPADKIMNLVSGTRENIF